MRDLKMSTRCWLPERLPTQRLSQGQPWKTCLKARLRSLDKDERSPVKKASKAASIECRFGRGQALLLTRPETDIP